MKNIIIMLALLTSPYLLCRLLAALQHRPFNSRTAAAWGAGILFAFTGTGHFIHTYQGDGAILPSFSGEPVSVAIENGFSDFADRLWDALNPENKVSLYVRYTRLDTGAYEDRIYNQYAR